MHRSTLYVWLAVDRAIAARSLPDRLQRAGKFDLVWHEWAGELPAIAELQGRARSASGGELPVVAAFVAVVEESLALGDRPLWRAWLAAAIGPVVVLATDGAAARAAGAVDALHPDWLRGEAGAQLLARSLQLAAAVGLPDGARAAGEAPPETHRDFPLEMRRDRAADDEMRARAVQGVGANETGANGTDAAGGEIDGTGAIASAAGVTAGRATEGDRAEPDFAEPDFADPDRADPDRGQGDSPPETPRERERSLQTVLDSTSDGIAIIDRQGIIRYANRGFGRLFRRLPETAIGAHFGRPVVADSPPETLRERAAELDLLRADGTTGVGEMRATRCQWQGEPAYAVTVRDISERKTFERALARRVKLESALAQTSRLLVALEPEGFDIALACLGTAFAVDRALLLQVGADGTHAHLAGEWCEADRAPLGLTLFPLDLAHLGWSRRRLRSNHPVALRSPRDLPPEASGERAVLLAGCLQAVLAVPAFDRKGRLWGALVLAASSAQTADDESLSSPRNWSDEDAQILRAAAAAFYACCDRQVDRDRLRASEALYSSIFNHSAEFIFAVAVRPDGAFVYETVNPAFERALGLQVRDVAGRTPEELFPPDRASDLLAYFRACSLGRSLIRYEETVRLPDGDRRWRTSLVPICDANGRVVKLQGSARDVTQERQAIERQHQQDRYRELLASLTLEIRQSLDVEDILRHLARKLQLVLQADRVFFFRLNPDGTGTVAHEAVASPYPSLLGKSTLYPLAEWEGDERHLAGYLQGRARVEDDIDPIALSPRDRAWVERYRVRAQVLVPVTLSRQEASRVRLGFAHPDSSTAEGQPSAGRLPAWPMPDRPRPDPHPPASDNPAISASGQEPEVEPLAIQPPTRRTLETPPSPRAIAGRGGARSRSTAAGESPRPPGAIAPQTLAPLETDGSPALSLLGTIGVQQCATARAWTEWEVDLLVQLANQVGLALYQAKLVDNQRRYARRLARSNQELEQFAYVASHDLQEPLRGIVSFAQLLQADWGDRLDADGRESLEFIIESGLRLRQLVRDLLQFARVGTRGRPFVPTDVNAVVADALKGLRAAIEEAQATVRVEPLPTVRADALQLGQLFQNLIGNALKFRSDGPPEIAIAARAVERGWEFCVADNGIGLAPEYGERIFAVFQRLHAREDYEGTGIGLAICRKIVERHGGRIWVNSREGRGARFYFILPTA